MGDEHEGDADALLELAQLDLHRLAQPLVESTQRFVEQEHLGAADQRAGERDALALAAAELVGTAGAEAFQLDHRQRIVHARREFGLAHTRAAQAVGDVVEHVEVRKDRVGLEHHVGRSQMRRHVGDTRTLDIDFAARREFEPGDHAQQRGLAAAGGAEQREKLATADRQDGVVDGSRAAEALGHVVDADEIFVAHAPTILCFVLRQARGC